jgi:hypothetical protein
VQDLAAVFLVVQRPFDGFDLASQAAHAIEQSGFVASDVRHGPVSRGKANIIPTYGI